MLRSSPAVRLRTAWASLAPGERRALTAMAAAVGGLHVLGFGGLALLAAHGQARVGEAGTLSLGAGMTAYTLGLRHAFDADHISAIDNSTRKLMSDGKRPVTVGFWFSLGHSTIVFGLALGLAVGIHSLAGPVTARTSHLHAVAGWLGTLVSGGFLYLIAGLNLVVLCGIVRVFREMRSGHYDEQRLEHELERRGGLNRIVGRFATAVARPAHMYPVGLLFGLGFDTATEVALLVLAGGAAGAGLPWYAILCLPILFAAGMSLLDSLDGTFMNFAYGWALSEPVRKVFYNLTITWLSVAVALVVGTVELGGLVARALTLSGSFWSWVENVDINRLGLLIAGMFAATWLGAATVWRLARLGDG